MKANELMIGDWVCIDEPDKYAGATGQIQSLMYHREGDAAYFHVFIQGKFGYVSRDVCSDDIRPIPLTSEILEKNGLEKDVHSYGIYDDYYDFEMYEYNDGTWLVSYHCCEMQLQDEQLLICYVHQLQHFMRHCGIEKEIKL